MGPPKVRIVDNVPVFSKADIRKIARNAISATLDLKHKAIAANTVDANSGEILGLCLTGNITRGDAEQNREADKIKLLRFRASLVITDSGIYVNNGDWNKNYRVIVGRYNGSNVGIASDSWQSNPFGMTAITQAGNTFFNWDGVIDTQKFKVILDRNYVNNPSYGYGSDFLAGEPTTTTVGDKAIKIEIDEKLGFNHTYDMDANTSQLGQLWLLVCAYSPSGSTNMADYHVCTDLQFHSY